MTYFIYNGKVFEEGTAVIGADSRALRYGDGVFETLKIKNGKLLLADEHFARLWKGMQHLKFDIPKFFSAEKLTEDILTLAKKNKQANARIRIGIYRGDGGLYDAQNNIPNYIIQSWALAEDNGKLNSNGLQLCIYSDAQKNCDALSNLKHNNYLPYVMGALFAKENKCNDAIILNNHQRVCDTTIANVFIVKNNSIYTPPLTEGCVAGVMRKFVIKALSPEFTVIEKEITKDDLLSADEVFLTNSIYNIRWVAALDDKKYNSEMVLKIDMYLRQTNGQVFC